MIGLLVFIVSMLGLFLIVKKRSGLFIPLIITAIILIITIGFASAKTSTSPSSISVTKDNYTEQIEIQITGSDNLKSVQLLVTGDTKLDEQALKDITSLYPSYFSYIDNTENKTTTLTVLNTDYEGTFSGDIVISHSAGDTKIPLSVTVKAENKISGLIPDLGRIVVIMTPSDTLEKEITVNNWTGYNLKNFKAYMKTTELYGGVDWVRITYEAPAILPDGDSTIVNAKVDPSNLKNGQYPRTLKLEAYYQQTKITSEVNLDFTIYGSKPVKSLSIDLPSLVSPSENLSIKINPEVEAQIFVGSTLAGTTDNTGHLTTTAPLKVGKYDVIALYKEEEKGRETIEVQKQEAVAIQLDKDEWMMGEKITGVVVTLSGNPVPNIKVSIEPSKTTYTNQQGRFSFETEDLKAGSHNIVTNEATSDYIKYGSANTTVTLQAKPENQLVWLAGGLIVVIAIILIWMHRDRIGRRISDLIGRHIT